MHVLLFLLYLTEVFVLDYLVIYVFYLPHTV